MSRAHTLFDIVGKRNGLGLINDGALVQEFLSGKEYVIDKVLALKLIIRCEVR